jgi:5'-nucleotidase
MVVQSIKNHLFLDNSNHGISKIYTNHYISFQWFNGSMEQIVHNYPVVVNHSTHISLVVQAFAFGKYLGKLDFQFDESGNINRYEGKPILPTRLSKKVFINL